MSTKNDRIRLVVVGVVVAIVLSGGGSAYADFTFGEPTNMGPIVNSSSEEGVAHTSADGLELYFYSERPGGYGMSDLYVATRQTTHDDWGTPLNLGPMVNSPHNDWGPNLSADGLTLFLASDRPDGYGCIDIWVTTRTTTDADWSVPVNLGETVNSSADDICPVISADGLQLYFSEWWVFRPGGYGGSDMWVTTRDTVSDPWGAPVNLGPTVNSSAHDDGPFITADGLALFFSSTRSGFVDMFMTRRITTEDDWSTPVNLGPVVNSSYHDNIPRISADGSTLYFTSDRSGGIGGFDLWQASIELIVDFNGDGIVDSADLCIMVDHWGEYYSLCDIGPTPLGDGIVDVEDIKVLSEHLFTYPGAVAYWKLDETEGMSAADVVGNNNAVVLGGAAWQPGSGQVDGALQLDGIDDCVVTDYVLDPADGPFNVFAWIKGGVPEQVVISQQGTANWLATDADGNLITELKCTGRSAGPLLSETVITNGQWHRVGLVCDGSHRTLFVDGVAVAEDTQPGLESSQMGLYIGTGKAMEPGTYFSGLIDDVRIYNRAVSP